MSVAELVVAQVRGRSVVERALARSPLHLLTPKNHGHAAWAFVASFGGGLVRGDHVALSIGVQAEATAVVTTQAQTKVYRAGGGFDAGQKTEARVEEGGLLALLPDPVACFKDASYTQEAAVRLAGARSSVVHLESLTCGRAAHGERWAFTRYRATTRVLRDERLLVHDATVLDARHGDIARRMARFEAMATLIAVGPRAAATSAAILARGERALEKHSDVVCSASALEAGEGAILRVAASSVDGVTRLLHEVLAPLTVELGDDPFARKW
jgi:urease accessory protein